MEDNAGVFVGIDVAKLRNAVAVADGQRNGEIRYLGEFDADEASMRRMVKRLADQHEHIMFCYEAGPTGYGLYCLIRSMGHECVVVAPSLIPRRPGDQVKTNRRDALGLGRLLRAGELKSVPLVLTVYRHRRIDRHQRIAMRIRARATVLKIENPS